MSVITDASSDPYRLGWVGTITTVSGRAFDLLNPTVDMVDLDDIATGLSHICRYNGQVPYHYSVAEHSVRVAWWLEDRGEPLRVQKAGLCHDAPETYTGDMVNPFKKTEAVGGPFRAAEAVIEPVVMTALDVACPLPSIVKEADQAIYRWEVDNIRSGKIRGWAAPLAREIFLDTFYDLTHLIRLDNNA